jgi:hypothetical protein
MNGSSAGGKSTRSSHIHIIYWGLLIACPAFVVDETGAQAALQ